MNSMLYEPFQYGRNLWVRRGMTKFCELLWHDLEVHFHPEE